eukprot:m.7984 g.7984  ORF g.7984 m.7984 type:complete len:224 (-) comp6001_c0_seq1:61-732(-)
MADAAMGSPGGVMFVAAENVQKSSSTGSLSTREYLEFYKVLNKFISTLGTAMSFVCKDLDSKIAGIEELLEIKPDHYKDLATMVKFETENDIADRTKKNTDSGCRQILRLHRALDFFHQLMLELAEADDGASSTKIASKIYGVTLANYHTWLVRQAAGAAFYTLPGCMKFKRIFLAQLVEDTSTDDADCAVDLDVIHSFAAMVKDMYSITDGLLKTHDLLDLP